MTTDDLKSRWEQHPVMRTPVVWYDGPRDPGKRFAVVLFRRSFELQRGMRDAVVWVSASQRFELYRDGELLARGPSRSDPLRWHAVPVHLGKLNKGAHTLAVRVSHFGDHAGIGQMGGPGFFLLAAEQGKLGQQINTGDQWRCMPETARTPIKRHHWRGRRPYYVVGSGERIDASALHWGWEQHDYDDVHWPAVNVVCHEAANPWGNVPLEHLLRPDPLPLMQESVERFTRVAQAPASLQQQAQAWIAGRGGLTIAANSRIRIVLDRGALTNAYPVFTLSAGRGARIDLVGAEAPYDNTQQHKSNRDDVQGKQLYGHRDCILPDGGTQRTLTTLWFRALRYLVLNITTADQPLILDDLHLRFTGYPLEQRASVKSPVTPADANDQSGPANARLPLASVDLDRIWDVSWRTIRLCAHETFFDCPHYEQAQFPGDSRIQAIYHYLISDEDRLARKAIDDFHASRIPDGLTQCRYPSRRLQILPTFSLYWIGMMHDLLRWRGYADELRFYFPAARAVLDWFHNHLRPDGMLARIGHAPFVDWTPAFACGNAPQDEDGGSAILTLLLARACQWQAQLEQHAGYPQLVPHWHQRATALVRATRNRCWDAQRKLLRDTSDGSTFSVHAQVEAVLAGMWKPRQAAGVLRRAMADQDIAQPGSFYYRYYLVQALKAVGLRADVLEQFRLWHQALQGTGLTTWPETARDNPRSDCHAWSVTPAIEMLTTLVGLEPAPDAVGMSMVRLEPEPGPWLPLVGRIPTPHGPITATLTPDKKSHLIAELRTPVPILVPGRHHPLKPGNHRIRIATGA